MDLEVRWLPEAIEDSESIAEYIVKNSEYYVQAIVTEIMTVARNNCDFPFRGRVVPEIGDEKI